MRLDNRLGELTYSTLVHPGDTWAEMKHSLQTYVPQVKRAVSPSAPFGVSLRISGASAEALLMPGERAALKEYLDQQDLYLYTVNAFPYGPFKGRSVMEKVYEPDWSTEARVAYTIAVADILVDVTPAKIEPSIQTMPLAFRPNVTGPDFVERLTRNVLRVVAHLIELERGTGRVITLALEPEPFCYLETTRDTVDYFQERLYTAAAAQDLGRLAGIPLSEAHGAMRRHLGIVFDIGHQTVVFDDIPESLRLLGAAGVPVFKLQEASALWVPNVDADMVEELGRFTDTIYLSQTTELRNGRFRRFLTLADGIAAWRADPSGEREWRTHFHVPVFLAELGAFRTTRFGVEQALALHREVPQSAHLEIETYTWDVLPEEFKFGDIVDYVVRELEWVQVQLTSSR